MIAALIFLVCVLALLCYVTRLLIPYLLRHLWKKGVILTIRRREHVPSNRGRRTYIDHAHPGVQMLVQLQATPIATDQYILECSECGPVGTQSCDDINQMAFNHLKDVHGVDIIEWGLGPA